MAPTWADLTARCGASFFLTPHWVETWLEVFGEDFDPQLIVLSEGGMPVAACMLVRRLFWRKFVPMRRVYLNCAGEDEADETCIEYNRFLCLRGREPEAAGRLIDWLGAGWDELVLNGMESIPSLGACGRSESEQKPSHYVDLAALRAAGASYDSVLSGNTRHQIRRSIRFYEQTYGTAEFEQARDQASALSFLEELAALHQKSWSGRGKPGVFASEKFCRFHRRLIERGPVDLLRVRAGRQVVGLLHCFFHGGRVYFYQSGFHYLEDNRGKPGLVTHYMAINHYLAERPDVTEYDFLAGDSRYKRSLAKEHRMLEWAVVQRPTLRVRTLGLLRTLQPAG